MGASLVQVIGSGVIVPGVVSYTPPTMPDVLYLVYDNAGHYITLTRYVGILINGNPLWHLVPLGTGAPWAPGFDVWLTWEDAPILWRAIDLNSVCTFNFPMAYAGPTQPLANPVGVYTCVGGTCSSAGQNTYVTDVHP
jgi:hypothetical protein